MSRKIIICCQNLLVGLVILVSLVACKDSTPAEPATFIKIVSTSNTSIKLYFDNPISEAAHDITVYKIIRPPLCDDTPSHAQLKVINAELSEDAKVITLTTAAQSATNYQFTLNALTDMGGNLVTISEQEPLLIFRGSGSQVMDSDEDGISDAEEQYGWAVRTMNTAGISSCRDVNSDPNKKDTDGDGVEDSVEMSNTTDPRSQDTDGDNLYDGAEINDYFSNPLHADTDQDGISDGIEAHQLHTSPALMDTDGDGMSDSHEVNSGGTNPRIANLPEIQLDLHGNPSIILNMSIGEEQDSKHIQTTLEQDREEQMDTDNSSTQMSIQNTVALHTEAEIGTSHWPPSANAKLTTDTEFKHGYMHETSSNWTQESMVESQDKFESFHKEHTEINYDDGMLWVAMKITNNSNKCLKLKDLSVIAYRMLPGGSFSTVGSLTPGEKSTDENDNDQWDTQLTCADPEDPSACGEILSPGEEIVLVMGADSLPAQEMKALFSNPSALMFEVGSYSLFELDEWGIHETVNVAKLGESVLQQTGTLVIDFGDGRVDRFMVATNTHRNPDGSGIGITLEEALKEVIGITDYELCSKGKTLCRINTVSTFRCDDPTINSEDLPDVCPPRPPLSVSTTVNPSTYDTVGDVITYSFEVTNLSNMIIGGPIQVINEKLTDLSCPIEDLAPGDSLTCTGSFTITQPDLDAGIVTNETYVTGIDPVGELVTSSTDSKPVSATHEIVQADILPIPKGFWMVAGTGEQFEGNSNLSFEEILLMNGERISLVYMQDSDGDGIYDREEYLLGTDKFNTDTDGDGLSDYQETREGWEVASYGQPSYQVFSDPCFLDFDEDFLTDSMEYSIKTDPNLADTDRDTLADGIDPYPTAPPCMDPTALFLTAWWDPKSDTEAQDLAGAEPLKDIYSDGTIIGSTSEAPIKLNLSNETIFRFNLQPEQKNQYIAVNNQDNESSIDPNREFTIAARVYWQGVAAGSDKATILSKGPIGETTYNLSILPDGRLEFSLYRNVHQKRWYCSWFGKSNCDDNAAKDKDYKELTTITTTIQIPQEDWTHIAASFGGETMRIYINGEIATEYSTNPQWYSGWNKNKKTTNYLVSNNDPLLIAVEKTENSAYPYRGLMNDIQFYIRMLKPDEVYQVYNLGVCQP